MGGWWQLGVKSLIWGWLKSHLLCAWFISTMKVWGWGGKGAKSALAKSWSGRGISHQPVFMGNCLTIGPMCFSPCLIDELILMCCISPSHGGASGGSLDVFQHMVKVVSVL